MDTKEFEGKILWFETLTHPPDNSALFSTQGWAKMSAGSSHVSVMGEHFPGAKSGWNMTFLANEVANFKRNDERKRFEFRGEWVTPDYIYIAAKAKSKK